MLAHLFEPADIDTTSIEMLPDDPPLYAFRIRLSGTPDNVWIRTFNEVWKRTRYLAKLDARVQRESIRFICRQSQGMEDYLYFIESRIEATNQIVEAYWHQQGVPVERLKYQALPDGFRPLNVV